MEVGAQGHLLVKPESGQYQQFPVGPGVVPGTAMAQPATTPPVQTVQSAAAPVTRTVQTIPSAAVQSLAGLHIGATYRVPVPVGSNVQPLSNAVNATAAAPQTSTPTSARVSLAPATTTNSGSEGGNSGQVLLFFSVPGEISWHAVLLTGGPRPRQNRGVQGSLQSNSTSARPATGPWPPMSAC